MQEYLSRRRQTGAGPMAEPSAKIIDGSAIAGSITETVHAASDALTAAGIVPGLAVVLVGADPASEVYVRNKGRTAAALGFHSVQLNRPATISETELLALVEELNQDQAIHGILVQMPLPSHIDPSRIIEAIRPDKDVDGFHPVNVGRLATGSRGTALVPCTPAGSMILIRHALGADIAGLRAVVIGRSNIVGKPVAQLLLQENCTVTIAHSRTRDLPGVVREADIVVAAVGRARLVRGDWIKPGATVIDVGMNRIPAPERGEGQTRLVGDVAFDEAALVAGWITPVPKGVGPMTIAMLMANTVTAASRIAGLPEPSF
ncbi:MAG: bifunctional methylenetetrahydrofolate dehydrogenase/methenyltetrahydrofolate cyclohydrolase FolD [Bauldia sp.]|nr:bifunctional methylenetetrahydrofolate dehydrogenase/methenyltetrahydrofolate cyclohydrolase FolD [Bauldia sp.]